MSGKLRQVLFAAILLVAAASLASPANAQLSGVVGSESSGVLSGVGDVIGDVVESPGEILEGEAEEGGGVIELNEALEAIEQQRAIPLEELLAIVAQYTSAPIVDVQLILVQDVLLYEVRTVGADGLVSILYFYALTGAPVPQ